MALFNAGRISSELFFISLIYFINFLYFPMQISFDFVLASLPSQCTRPSAFSQSFSKLLHYNFTNSFWLRWYVDSIGRPKRIFISAKNGKTNSFLPNRTISLSIHRMSDVLVQFSSWNPALTFLFCRQMSQLFADRSSWTFVRDG